MRMGDSRRNVVSYILTKSFQRHGKIRLDYENHLEAKARSLLDSLREV